MKKDLNTRLLDTDYWYQYFNDLNGLWQALLQKVIRI